MYGKNNEGHALFRLPFIFVGGVCPGELLFLAKRRAIRVIYPLRCEGPNSLRWVHSGRGAEAGEWVSIKP